MRRLLVVLLLALALAPVAHAAPPVVATVGLTTDTRAILTWTLPVGGQDFAIEVASSPAVDADGGFLAANVVDTDAFLPGTALTSWTGAVPLDPGTYYVHVAASDLACTTCPSYEWSTVRTLVVASTKPDATTTAPATTTTAPAATTPAVTTSRKATEPATTASASVSGVRTTREGGIETLTATVCGAGSARLRVAQTLTRSGRTAATAASTYT